jgi:hypothetical protein
MSVRILRSIALTVNVKSLPNRDLLGVECCFYTTSHTSNCKRDI